LRRFTSLPSLTTRNPNVDLDIFCLLQKRSKTRRGDRRVAREFQ
jgi:hypothetical protein